MIAGLCECPLTVQAIVIWRDELNEGKVFLRDIIDLDATHAGPVAKAMPAPAIGPDGQLISDIATPGQPGRLLRTPAVAIAAVAPLNLPTNALTERSRQPERRSATATSMMTTIWRIGSRSPQSRPSSSPR